MQKDTIFKMPLTESYLLIVVVVLAKLNHHSA